MNIDQDLTCKCCNRIFNDPISLFCCGENVCKEHFDQMEILRCPLCSQSLPKQNFEVNKLLKKLIDDRKIQNFKIEPEYNEVLANYKQRLSKIKSIHDDPENFIYEKFAELKRQVDLDKEKAIQKIEKLADDLINKLNSVEEELKIECKKNSNSAEYDKFIRKMSAQLDDYECSLKTFNDSDRKAKIKEIKESISAFDKQIIGYERKLFKYQLINYVPFNTDFLDGELDIIKTDKHAVKHLLGSDSVISLISINKNCLASGDDEGTIKIWNLDDESDVKTLRGHSEHVWSMVLLNGDRLASAGEDNLIQIWDLKENELLRTLVGHTDQVYALVLWENENLLVSGSFDSTIKIWNYNTGTLIESLEGHRGPVCTLTYTTSDCLASGGDDMVVRIWNLKKNICIKKLKGHKKNVYALKYLGNERLASAGEDKTIIIWDLLKSNLLRTLKGHLEGILTLSLLKNGYLASGGQDETIKIWNLDEGKLVRSLKGHTEGIQSLVCLENGYLASASGDNRIIIWDVL